MREMTDIEAVLGPYRAVLCEWTHPAPCLQPVEPGKAYCPECMKKAYRTVNPKANKNNE